MSVSLVNVQETYQKKKKKKDSLDVPKNKSEDCLYLEVYAPPPGRFAEKAAVILWFHGGDWHEGGLMMCDYFNCVV